MRKNTATKLKNLKQGDKFVFCVGSCSGLTIYEFLQVCENDTSIINVLNTLNNARVQFSNQRQFFKLWG